MAYPIFDNGSYDGPVTSTDHGNDPEAVDLADTQSGQGNKVTLASRLDSAMNPQEIVGILDKFLKYAQEQSQPTAISAEVTDYLKKHGIANYYAPWTSCSDSMGTRNCPTPNPWLMRGGALGSGW